VLLQDGPMVACASRQLRKREEHYPTPDLELAIIVRALKIWRYYLMERDLNTTDHKDLKYIFIKPNLTLR
jgi:hypothetical protein